MVSRSYILLGCISVLIAAIGIHGAISKYAPVKLTVSQKNSQDESKVSSRKRFSGREENEDRIGVSESQISTTSETDVETRVQREKFRKLLSNHSTADVLQIQNWVQARGWSSKSYKSYDDKTLQQMSDLGDGLASQELARRISNRDPLRAIELFEQAAEQGYSSSTVMAGQLNWRMAEREADAMNKSDLYIDAYSWALVGQIRNDPSAFEFTRHLERMISWESEDIEIACSRAISTYEQMTNARASKGAGDFDNTPPEKTFENLASAGRMCNSWPVRRATCNAVPLSDEFSRISVRICSL